MAFISKSITDATKIGTSVTDLNRIQSGFTGSISEISKAAASSISSKALDPINKATITVTGVSNNIPTNINGILSQVNSGIGSVNSYLQSAVKSITSTFDSSIKGLASGLDSSLSGLFKETNVKTASATTTLISDPIKTNLLDVKIPTSSSFKINGLQAGSQVSGAAGAINQLGSNASSMISTNLSTVMNRLNFDSANGLVSGITSTKQKNDIKSLFSTVSNIRQTIGGVSSTIRSISELPNVLSASVSRSIENNLQSFIGRSSSLSSLTGSNPSDYYIGSDKLVLQNQDGDIVETTGSGTDATTANALLSIAKLIGCDTNGVTEYSSVDELSSLFNMILSIASKQGLSSLVESLLGCSSSTTAGGQQSIFRSLSEVADKDITLTNTLLGSITNSSTTYKNKDIAKKIVSNGNLVPSDTAAVIAALGLLEFSPTDIYESVDRSGGSVKTYNLDILTTSEKSILDSLFEDKTMSTYLTGQTVTLQPNGTYWI